MTKVSGRRGALIQVIPIEKENGREYLSVVKSMSNVEGGYEVIF